jgi:hypothetical protein
MGSMDMKIHFNPFNTYFILFLYREYKKPKKVKFSAHNQIQLIHTIDEIKEYLPDMYWKFDEQRQQQPKKTPPSPNKYYQNPAHEQYYPLKRNEFIFEKKKNYYQQYEELPVLKSLKKTQPIRIVDVSYLKRSKSDSNIGIYDSSNKYL